MERNSITTTLNIIKESDLSNKEKNTIAKSILEGTGFLSRPSKADKELRTNLKIYSKASEIFDDAGLLPDDMKLGISERIALYLGKHHGKLKKGTPTDSEDIGLEWKSVASDPTILAILAATGGIFATAIYLIRKGLKKESKKKNPDDPSRKRLDQVNKITSNALKRSLSSCRKTRNPEKCRERITKMIHKLER